MPLPVLSPSATVLWWLVCFLSAVGVTGQAPVRSTVVDAVTGQPVPFATAYFDGTTLGTVTDEAGEFTLPAPPASGATLAVTHIGYRSYRLRLTGKTAPRRIRLEPVPTVTVTVEVEDRNNRENNLREFRERYLGKDEWGRRARIKNEAALQFERNYDNDTLPDARPTDLRARSLAPLEIDLPDLGYRVLVDLIHFVADYRTGGVRFLASYFYQPYEGKGSTQARHARNRRTAYYNSPQHFLRALYRDSLEAEGFAVYTDNGRAIVPIELSRYVRPGSEQGHKIIRGLRDREIIILYYGDREGHPLPPGKRFLRSPESSRMQVPITGTTFRTDGTMPNNPLVFAGALGRVTLSSMLPSDYVPD